MTDGPTDRQVERGLAPLEFGDLVESHRASGAGLAGVGALAAAMVARCRAHIHAYPGRRRGAIQWLVGGALFGAGLLGLSSAPSWSWALYAMWTILVGVPVWLLQGYVRTIDGRPFDAFLLPNGLTWLRLVLAPLAIWPLLLDDGLPQWMRVGLLVGLAALDLLDGQIARRAHLESRLGRMLDPTADLALMGWLATGLYLEGMLPGLAYAVIMIRYPGTVVSGALVITFFGAYDVESTKLGKVAGFSTSVILSALAVEDVLSATLLAPTVWSAIVWALTGLLAVNFVYLFIRALALRPTAGP
jgi:cardiolipin synthase